MYDVTPNFCGGASAGGCKAVPRRKISFARRQPPIRPVLNALLLLPATSQFILIVSKYFQNARAISGVSCLFLEMRSKKFPGTESA